MNKEFEKIIEKLEELFQDLNVIEVLSHVDFDSTIQNSLENFLKAITNEAIEIVKQEAEKYEECYKDCGDCEAYEKEKHYCPKFCNVIKETVKEIEANHNDWIPCSERLPETSGEYLTWVKYDGKEFHSIDEIDCDGIFKEWNCSSDYKIIAWMHLPTQYQPKGEHDENTN